MSEFNVGLPKTPTYAPTKLPIWRSSKLRGLPLLQEACTGTHIAVVNAAPLNFYNGTYFFALPTSNQSDVYVYNSTFSAGGNYGLGTAQVWRGIASNSTNTLLVAAGGANTTTNAYSTNGTTWNVGAFNSPADWGQVAFAAGTFVVVTNGTSSSTQYGTNGTSWTTGSCPSTVNGIVAVNNRFYVGSGGSVGYYSTDGINWNSISGSASTLSTLLYAKGAYYGANLSNGIVYKSTDGIAFSYLSNIPPNANNYAYSCWGFDVPSGQFIAVSSTTTDGTIMCSLDGISWYKRNSLAYNTSTCTIVQGPNGAAYIQQNASPYYIRTPNRSAMEVTYLL